MLVRLYDLPDEAELRRKLALQGTQVRRAMAYEKDVVGRWVEAAFGERASGWRSECEVAFARSPLACHIAVCDAAMVGFACYDSTCKNFLGPIGVADDRRGGGIGKLLLITTLRAMRAEGYGYAIIGQVGAPAFFSSAVGAVEIPGSMPGIYPQRLKA
jgi:GNAT superfamily N-acetyltransferase